MNVSVYTLKSLENLKNKILLRADLEQGLGVMFFFGWVKDNEKCLKVSILI